MKRLLFILTLMLPLISFAQRKSCCMASPTENFAQLASNEKFTASHSAPLPFTYSPEKGKLINYKCADGKPAKAFEIRAEQPTENWLIVIHEWWGLNDYIMQEAEKLATDIPNTNVLAVDLYDGNVAKTPQEAQALMEKMTDGRSRSILQGALSYTGSKSKIATIGWCMGGGWSLQTALMAGKQAIACVMYYGMPESEMDKLKELNCDVLGIFATKDDWINKEVVDNFEKNMSAAGKKLIVRNYDANHAFANPSNPNHDKEATEDAYKNAIQFLKEHIK